MSISSQPWIADLELALGAKLPAELRALYEQGDGEKDLWPDRRPMRLLPSSEALSECEQLSRAFDLRGSCPFWVSDNGDHGMVFLSGPLRGRVGLWDSASGYPSDPVAYRSAASFVASLNDAAKDGLDWYEMPSDYFVGTSYYSHGAGVRKEATPEEVESDRAAFQALVAAYDAGEFGDDREEFVIASNAIALAPPEETGAVLRFLDSVDMYVQENACNELGHRRYAPAIERLGRAARGARGNGQCAAVTARGKIGTDPAREEILASVSAFEPGLDLLIDGALRNCGCETRFDEDKFRVRTYYFRLPNESTWNRLRD